jgi:hypothetical protein
MQEQDSVPLTWPPTWQRRPSKLAHALDELGAAACKPLPAVTKRSSRRIMRKGMLKITEESKAGRR